MGGYIYAEDDVAGGVWYFSAPETYRGNRLDYYGATLQFSLLQDSSMSNQFESGDVIFESGDKKITYVHSPQNFPTLEWTSYSIPIQPGSGWLKGEYDSGVLASEAEIKDVLSNVTEFRIRGEFESGPDSGGLDRVIIDN